MDDKFAPDLTPEESALEQTLRHRLSDTAQMCVKAAHEHGGVHPEIGITLAFREAIVLMLSVMGHMCRNADCDAEANHQLQMCLSRFQSDLEAFLNVYEETTGRSINRFGLPGYETRQ